MHPRAGGAGRGAAHPPLPRRPHAGPPRPHHARDRPPPTRSPRPGSRLGQCGRDLAGSPQGSESVVRGTHAGARTPGARRRAETAWRVRAQRETAGAGEGGQGGTGRTTGRVCVSRRVALGGSRADPVRAAKDMDRGGVREEEQHGACGEGRGRKDNASPFSGCF